MCCSPRQPAVAVAPSHMDTCEGGKNPAIPSLVGKGEGDCVRPEARLGAVVRFKGGRSKLDIPGTTAVGIAQRTRPCTPVFLPAAVRGDGLVEGCFYKFTR
jgi:hypothetical protein